jgi:hypothetical protein
LHSHADRNNAFPRVLSQIRERDENAARFKVLQVTQSLTDSHLWRFGTIRHPHGRCFGISFRKSTENLVCRRECLIRYMLSSIVICCRMQDDFRKLSNYFFYRKFDPARRFWSSSSTESLLSKSISCLWIQMVSRHVTRTERLKLKFTCCKIEQRRWKATINENILVCNFHRNHLFVWVVLTRTVMQGEQLAKDTVSLPSSYQYHNSDEYHCIVY